MNLAYADEHGLLGRSYYWDNFERMGMTKDDVLGAGLTGERIQVDESIVPALRSADATLQQRGFRLYLKEGYRPEALYEIAYARRVAKFGKAATDKLLNMEAKPHVLGTSVDVCLWNEREGTEVAMKSREDGPDALIADFYLGKPDERSRRYHELQTLLIGTMQAEGFRFGRLREYFHFDYRPETEPNYP